MDFSIGFSVFLLAIAVVSLSGKLLMYKIDKLKTGNIIVIEVFDRWGVEIYNKEGLDYLCITLR